MDEERRNVGGIPMRWLERGTGLPVVLVHGIPTSPRLWRHVIPKLEGVRVLAWEMVGYGDSFAAGADVYQGMKGHGWPLSRQRFALLVGRAA